MMLYRWSAAGCLMIFLFGCSLSTAINSRPTPENHIRLTVNAPGARSVDWLSSTNRYKPIPMQPVPSGSWEITVPANQDFEYFFQVDGKILVTNCRWILPDDWGGTQCLHIAQSNEVKP